MGESAFLGGVFAGVAGSISVGDWEGIRPLSNPWWWLNWTAGAVAMSWVGVEGFIQYPKARQSMRGAPARIQHSCRPPISAECRLGAPQRANRLGASSYAPRRTIRGDRRTLVPWQPTSCDHYVDSTRDEPSAFYNSERRSGFHSISCSSRLPSCRSLRGMRTPAT